MTANFHMICRSLHLSRPLRRTLLTAFASLAATTLFAGAPDTTPDTAVETAAKPVNTDYRIAPNDQINFHITGEVDLPLIQRVTSQGQISIPLLGAVKVAGLTLRESEALMEKRYRDEGYFIDPQVILSVETYAPRSVSVLGQVTNPNQIDFPIERSEIGIVNAITRAGGFTRIAQIDAVKVMRTVNGKEVSFTVNVAAYLNKTAHDEEFKVLPNDIIFVPERVF